MHCCVSYNVSVSETPGRGGEGQQPAAGHQEEISLHHQPSLLQDEIRLCTHILGSCFALDQLVECV